MREARRKEHDRERREALTFWAGAVGIAGLIAADFYFTMNWLVNIA